MLFPDDGRLSTLSGRSRRQKAAPHFGAPPLSRTAIRTCHPASGLPRLRPFAPASTPRRDAFASLAILDIVQRRIYHLNTRLNHLDNCDRETRSRQAQIRDVESA